MKNRLTLLRLQKQQRKIEQQQIPNVMVARKDVLNFHFCIYGLDGSYEGGYYHGVLQLHQQYPFSPPKLIFYTPSGRFQPNKPICTTFTNFHKQAWTSAWNVRTMLMATVSFMTSDEGGYGSLNDSSAVRRKYAAQSLNHNIKNSLFCSLFKSKLLLQNKEISKKLLGQNLTEQSKPNSQDLNQRRIQNNNGIYFLYLLLIAIIIIWALYKLDS